MSSLVSGVLLETATAASKTGAWISILMYLVIIGAFFYFFLFRPQKKQQRTHDTLISSIKAGDSILTTSGFYGIIIDVMDEIVIVEFGNNKNCRIPMKKDAIVEVEKEESDK